MGVSEPSRYTITRALSPTPIIKSIYECSLIPMLRIPTRRLFRRPYHLYTISDDTVLGIIALVHLPTHTHIDYLCVSGRSRGGGIGSKLLEWATTRHPLVTLECLPQLVPYYEARGFRKWYRYKWRGMSMVFMVSGKRHLHVQHPTDVAEGNDLPPATRCQPMTTPKVVHPIHPIHPKSEIS